MLSLPRKPSSWLGELLAGAAVLSGVGYWLTAYTVSRWLTRPSRGTPRPTPADLNLPYKDVECRTSDGLRLAGWVVTPPRSRGTVALFHGLRHNRSQTLPRIAMLTAAGFRCVAFDHRAHGQSGGRYASFGYHERRDVEAVLDFIRQRWPDEPCAALGISMGAAALCFASKNLGRLDACVLESLYHDVASAFEHRLGTKFPNWFRRFARGTVWITERRLGVTLAQITPADHIAVLADIPLLLVTGSADVHAPPSDSRRLHSRRRGPCELAEVEGADHTNLCTKDGAAYESIVVEFLSRHVGRRACEKPLAA